MHKIKRKSSFPLHFPINKRSKVEQCFINENNDCDESSSCSSSQIPSLPPAGKSILTKCSKYSNKVPEEVFLINKKKPPLHKELTGLTGYTFSELLTLTVHALSNYKFRFLTLPIALQINLYTGLIGELQGVQNLFRKQNDLTVELIRIHFNSSIRQQIVGQLKTSILNSMAFMRKKRFLHHNGLIKVWGEGKEEDANNILITKPIKFINLTILTVLLFIFGWLHDAYSVDTVRNYVDDLIDDLVKKEQERFEKSMQD